MSPAYRFLTTFFAHSLGHSLCPNTKKLNRKAFFVPCLCIYNDLPQHHPFHLWGRPKGHGHALGLGKAHGLVGWLGER